MAKEKQVPFQKIPEASKSTGLSMYFLRRGCWGDVLHQRPRPAALPGGHG